MPGAKTVAEFFAGIGLMRLGLERAGWSVVWANDHDPDKAALYRHHFGGGPGTFALGDVGALAEGAVPPAALATASFPCTDLSLAGARSGLSGSGSGAFWGFAECLKNMGRERPPLVLLENVPGWLTSRGGDDFRRACAALNALGYAVDAFVADAARFVPQSRRRLFVVGSRGLGGATAEAGARGLEASECRPEALAGFMRRHPEIAWAVRPLPAFPRSPERLPDIVEDVPPESARWWSRERADYLLEQMSPKHRAVAEAMIAAPERSFGTVFRRVRQGRSMAELRTDGVAGCLRTPRGGSGRQILFVAGNGRRGVRLLTPRECARLMGAGDYRLDETMPLNKALFGFGDAVCVSVVEWIARHYLNPLWAGSAKEAPADGPRARCHASPASFDFRAWERSF